MITSIDAALSTTADALALDILRGATRALGSPQSNVSPQSTIHLPGPGPWDLSDFDDTYDIFVWWGINTTIYALGGNDTLSIYGGASTVYGGAGNDSIYTAENGAVFYGEDDDDTLIATGGDAMLIGGNGNDTLRAVNYTDGLNWLYGGVGNDVLMTFGVGNAYLDGGDGDDQFYVLDAGSTSLLFGGAGNDGFFLQSGTAYVDGGDGSDDFVNYQGSSVGVSLNLTNQQLNAGGAAGQLLFNIESYFLSNHDDVFVGADAADLVIGWRGRDVLQGGGGDDLLFGGSGDDVLFGGDGNDGLLGGEAFRGSIFEAAGNDSLYGGNGNDLLAGEDGNDFLDGGAGADALNGGEGYDIASYLDAMAAVSIDLTLNSSTWTGDAQGDLLFSIEEVDLSYFSDTFRGDANANSVHGGGGDDQIYGLGGDDILLGEYGSDFLVGGAGADTLLGGDGYDTASYRNATTGVSIDLTSASTAWTGEALGDVLTSIEQFDLSDFADSFRGDANRNTVFGGNGADSLDGGDGNDFLDGGAGADILSGGAGFDTVSYRDATAGVGIDLTKASSTWAGDALGDVLTSIEQFELSEFADTFRGDASVNNVRGDGGDDQLFGAGGDDWLHGGSGNDTIQGGDGNDFLGGDGYNGNSGDDYLQGNAGDDVLNGDGGNDRMVGGIGNDRLWGGLGGDFLAGNEGADIFQYSAVEQSQNVTINGVSQRDQISDFTQGQDKIDLSLIDANPELDGDQAFTFIADPAHYTGNWTGVVWQTTAANGIVTVNVSIDGDADPEMQIYMSHPYQLTANDFIL